MDPSQLAASAAHFHSQPPLTPPSHSQPQPPVSAAYGHPSPAPSPSSSPLPSHPSYTEMITAAILWENSQGKEGGSSKRAIAKYIDRVYSNLPPTHSALLTHHLIRLKNSGQLTMIKNSYQLSSLSAPQPSTVSAIPPSPHQQFLQASSTTLIEQSTPSTKRSPGRPLKLKQPDSGAENVPQAKPETEHLGSEPLTGKKRRGRPAKVAVPLLKAEPEVGLELLPSIPSAGVSNGQVEEGSLMKQRGRPKKKQKQQEVEMDDRVVVEPQPMFQVEVEEALVDEVDVVKRGAGRPKKVINYNKNDSDGNATGLVLDNVQQVNVVKRGAGRPKKIVNENDNYINATGLVSDNVEKRKKRGWPAGRPRGKRVVAMAVSGVRRRGRKPKGRVGMVEKKMYTGKTRGRPKKNSHGQEVANEELLRNLEDMQSKLRVAVGILRPHLANLSAPDALIALQQLEELSTMNVTSSSAVTALTVMNVPIDVTAPPPSTAAPEVDS